VYPKQYPIMKIKQKFLLAGAIVTVASAPSLWAGKADAEPTPAVEETSTTPDEELVVDEGEVVITLEEPEDVVSDRPVDGEPVEKGEVTEGEPTELVDPPVFEAGGPEVQRGEVKNLDPDVIFQTTALDGGGEAAPVGKAEAGFGSDERAAQIESKGSRISAVKSEKKGPVALVKKGRVFLR
jgi:hypothetical protein